MMVAFTQQRIDELVDCDKVVTASLRRDMKQVGRAMRNEMRLESVDGKSRFVVFIRVSIDFPENFSAGLDFLADDGSRISLLRCNGPHEGWTPDPARPNSWHYGCHIHRARELEALSGEDPMKNVERTTAYSDDKEALRHLLKICKLSAAEVEKNAPLVHPTLPWSQPPPTS
jgi:hypothetical protein